jgi:tRNA threonylcarbamoyladenosine biosynthesis protein TsaE
MSTMPAGGLPARLTLRDPAETHALGVRLAAVLRAGDLVVLAGGLGAGKTTLTQGIGEGLGVRGPITSPTFVIARAHPSLVGGPGLVHADAYRLGGIDELDTLDLDTTLEESVTVVEWGHGLAEDLAESYLEVSLSGETERTAVVEAYGERWAGAAGRRLAEAVAGEAAGEAAWGAGAAEEAAGTARG